MFVFDADLSTTKTVSHSTKPRERAVDDQHPAAAQSEVLSLAKKLDQDPAAQEDEGDADEAAHPRIERVGDC